MRVLVTGAHGLIGSACLARLHREDHELAAAGRCLEEAARRQRFARWIGALLRVRRFAKRALVVMLLATCGYLLAGTWLAPQLWADPPRPLLKIVPTPVAALTLAITDER